MKDRTATIAFGLCFSLALFASSRAQIGPAPGGGGGTPCTTTALSLQFNSAGAFGCATEWVYTAAKKSVGDGANFQIYWSTGNGDLEFRNSADNAYVSIFTGGVLSSANVSIATGKILGVGSIFSPTAAPAMVVPDATVLGSTKFGFLGVAGAQFAWASSTTTAATPDTSLSRNAAGVVEVNNGTTGTFRELKHRSLVSGGTVPGISGCTAGTQTGGGSAGTYTSGTTGTCTVVLTFAFTAPAGWSCWASDRTTPANLISQSASSTTTATLTGTTVTGDVIGYGCMAY